MVTGKKVRDSLEESVSDVPDDVVEEAVNTTVTVWECPECLEKNYSFNPAGANVTDECSDYHCEYTAML